jgi:predicted permease
MRWLKQLFARRRRYNELSESIREHIEEKIADLMDDGMMRQEAERTARREFGNVTLIEQRSREVWQWPTLESAWSDTKYALRRLRKSPGFTSIALLTLALGIGANTGIFTLIDAVVLKSLPVPQPEQLFLVKPSNHAAEKSRFSYSLFEGVSRQLPGTTTLAAMGWPDNFYIRTADGQSQPAQGQLVSGNYFQVFETYPVLGRLLTPSDDARLSGSAVVVVSYNYWQQHFGSDPNVIGHQLEVNGVPFVIVGVAAKGFFGARVGIQPDFWMPLTMQYDVHYHDHYSAYGAEPLKPWIPQPNINWLQLIVRVKSPADVPRLMSLLNQQYKSNLESLVQYLHNPDQHLAMLRVHLMLEPGQRGFANLREQFAQPLLLLMSMAMIVLLIACANIASLLLARAAARRHAFAIQLSIGSGRARLIQQMLVECVLLSIGGSTLGVAVAFWCVKVLPRWASAGGVSIPLNLHPDTRILVFSVIIALTTGMIVGLAPALQSANVDPVSVLKAGAQSLSGKKAKSRWSLRNTLVAAQVALSLLLLVGAGMFLQTFRNYSRLDPGFDRDRLLAVQIDTHLVNFQTSDFPPLYQRLVDGIEAIPGVHSASITTCQLVVGCHDSSDVILMDGRGKIAQANAQVNSVSPNYFETTGIHLLHGRDFVSTDNASSPKVAIVNQAFARHYFSDSDPIGLQFSYADNEPDRFQIVGLVTDARVNDIREEAPPIIYFPVEQNPGNIDGLEVRTEADPTWVAAQARRVVTDIDPRIPIVSIATLNQQVQDNLAQPRLIARLTTIFGMLALGLACLGLYGVMSYSIERRTSEIGIRLALGSTRQTVLRLVIWEALRLAGCGAMAGLVLAIVAMHMAVSFLFGLSPEDPPTIALAMGLLLLTSVVAGFIPAWRAANIDPIRALRTE